MNLTAAGFIAPDDADLDALTRAENWMLAPLCAATSPTHGPGREVARRLGVDLSGPDAMPFAPVTVVGSKGKGTTAISCSATLAAAGLRVGTVTSPSLTSPAERIRVDGAPISAETYVNAATRLRQVFGDVSAENPDWLLPGLGGRSMLAGLREFADRGVDAAVIEASMGGRSDLTHILPSTVVTITAVFPEHLGTLGDTLAEIAVEKLGAVTEHTRVVVTLPQSPEVLAAWQTSGLLDGVDLVVVPEGPHGHHPQPLTDMNIELGRTAAAQWLRLHRPDLHEQLCEGAAGQRLAPPASMRLPGRCHPVPGEGMVDCAIAAEGARAALGEYVRVYGQEPKCVFVCLPHTKDDTGVQQVLAEHPDIEVIAVDIPQMMDRLRPSATRWPQLAEFDHVGFATQKRFLAFGTVTFAACVLEELGEDTGRLW